MEGERKTIPKGKEDKKKRRRRGEKRTRSGGKGE